MTDNTETADRGAAALENEQKATRLEFTGLARWTMIAFTLAAIGIAINQLFGLRIGGVTLLEGMYLYVLAGLFLSLTFIAFRAYGPPSPNVPWYDWILALLVLGVTGFFVATAGASLDGGWEYAPPQQAVWASILLYVLILEGTRRAGGLVLFGIVLLFSLYPTFADRVPDPLNGFSQSFTQVVPFFMISSEASFGIPMRAFGNLVIGFILFGAVLQ